MEDFVRMDNFHVRKESTDFEFAGDHVYIMDCYGGEIQKIKTCGRDRIVSIIDTLYHIFKITGEIR